MKKIIKGFGRLCIGFVMLLILVPWMNNLTALLLQSSLSLEELEFYYAKYRKNDWSYIVQQQLEETIPVSGRANLSFSFPACNDISACKGAASWQYYIVYSWGDSDNPFHNLDLRGN